MNFNQTLAQLSTFVKDEYAIKSLRDLMQQTLVDESVSLANTFRLVPGVKTGDPLGWLGSMQPLGWAGSGCDPEYKHAAVQYAGKKWELGEWQLPLKWCYKEFESTLAEYALKKGADISKLEGTEIWSILIEGPVAKAVAKMWWRIIWFGDKQIAENHAADLTTAVPASPTQDPYAKVANIPNISNDLFTICNGLFKQFEAQGVTNTAIDANTKTTTALQFSELRKPGVATGIIESVLENADSRIKGNGGKLFVTDSIATALTKDLRNTYKNSTMMTWDILENGLKISQFDGVEIVAVNMWDQMIQEFFNNGTKLYNPHRVVFANKENLLVGTPENSVNADLEVNFDNISRNTFMYGTGKIGTNLGEEGLIHTAY